MGSTPTEATDIRFHVDTYSMETILHPRYIKKGLCLGPCDFPCTTDTAHELEADLKQAEKEGLTYTRTFISNSVKELNEGERTDISLITDATLDHDNEVVQPDGLDYGMFLKNPVVAFAHRYDEPPVGRSVWLKRHEGTIKAKTQYAVRPEGLEGPFTPDTIWALVSQKMLLGKSIGFVPLEAREPNQKDIDERPELSEARRIVTRCKMYEYSVCSLPCNPSALVEAVSKGLHIPDTIKALLGIPDQEAHEIATDIASCIVWDAVDYLPEPSTELVLPSPKTFKCLDDLEALHAKLQKRLAEKIKKDQQTKVVDMVVRKMFGRL